MSRDHIPDTPYVAVPICPGCEPERDITVGIIDVRYCHEHTPTWGGVDDGQVNTDAYLTGTGEPGGEDNRAWCDLLHRKKTLLRGA